jgi:hypothetical protein
MPRTRNTKHTVASAIVLHQADDLAFPSQVSKTTLATVGLPTRISFVLICFNYLTQVNYSLDCCDFSRQTIKKRLLCNGSVLNLGYFAPEVFLMLKHSISAMNNHEYPYQIFNRTYSRRLCNSSANLCKCFLCLDESTVIGKVPS